MKKPHQNGQITINLMTKLLIWSIALIFGVAATWRLYGWLQALPNILSSLQMISNVGIFVIIFSLLACLLGIWGAIGLVRFKKIAAFCLTIALALGIVMYLLTFYESSGTINFVDLPLKMWLFGTTCIIYLWILFKRGFLH